MRTRTLLGAAVAVVVIGGAGVAVARSREDVPHDRAYYCDPPKQVEALPPTTDVGVVASPGYEHLVTVENALGIAEAPDGRLFIAAKQGDLYQARLGEAPTKVVSLVGQLGTRTEQGLLGVAVDPAGSFLYLDATFADGTARVVEYPITPTGIDVGGERTVLSFVDPHPSHNGGKLGFDQAGHLLFGLGDGGDGAVTGASQDLGSLFGSILRIDPRPTASEPYGIPADNPYVGTPGARGEILAKGFRNPWGWSIDPKTQDLWVGDVGHLCREEIDMVPDNGRGANFGWPFLEGAHEFKGPLGPDGQPDPNLHPIDLGPPPKDLVGPILEYPHDDAACSVIGGVVYRGKAVPELDGTYLWADLCKKEIHTLTKTADGWETGTLGGEIPGGIVSFAQSADGEVYLLSLVDGVYRIAAPTGAP